MQDLDHDPWGLWAVTWGLWAVSNGWHGIGVSRIMQKTEAPKRQQMKTEEPTKLTKREEPNNSRRERSQKDTKREGPKFIPGDGSQHDTGRERNVTRTPLNL